MKNELGSVWYNCVLVRNSEGDLQWHETDDISNSLKEELKKYKKENPSYADDGGSIWYDLDNKFCFGSAQYKRWKGTDNLPRKDHSYSCNREDFHPWSQSLMTKILEKNEIFKNAPIQVNPDSIIGYPKFMEKFKDKTVMIVGGGPSSNSVNWDNLEFDYLWSINKFYLNEKVASRGVDLATIASHIDVLEEEELKDYITKNNTNISFELERDTKPKFKEMAKFADLYPEQTTFFHTRYKSQPGVGMRFICYAIMAGCKNIYFVGVDGFTPKGPLHSFEEDKENPNWYTKYGEDFQKRQFITFWDYLLKLKQHFNYNIYNLGEDHECNVSSEITKLVSPLPEHIKEKIK